MSEDFSISIHTPQIHGTFLRGGVRFPARMADLRAWLAGERWWDRTTGVLRVIRTVPLRAPHLEWVDIARISEGFSLALPSEAIDEADAIIERMIARDEWFEPVRRKDGEYDLEVAVEKHPRVVRRVSIYTAAAQIIVGECLDPAALVAFEAPPGYSVAISEAVPHDCRLELFQYEFTLLGRNSFSFRIALR
jgi:hypothetical protein